MERVWAAKKILIKKKKVGREEGTGQWNTKLDANYIEISF